MDIFSSTIYGIIQGLTEFLPVSSSGHLAILPHFLKIEDPGVLFDLSMHIGTALAVILYFRSEVKSLLIQSLNLLKGKLEGNYFAANTLLSTSLSVILILLLKGIANDYGRSLSFIIFNLSFFGLLMWLADYKGKILDEHSLMSQKLDIKRASFIGAFQALAIFPGVSRSGITLTISRWMDLSREEATRYSFLLSLPIIFGGMIFKIPEVMEKSQAFSLSACLWGTFISFVIGLFAIHSFLKVVGKIGLVYFSLYRVLLAILLYIFLF